MQIFEHWYILLILLVVVLIIWGPGKLPDVGHGLGRAIREFRKASTETTDAFKSATAEPKQEIPPATPSAPEQPGNAAQPVSDPTQQTPVSR